MALTIIRPFSIQANSTGKPIAGLHFEARLAMISTRSTAKYVCSLFQARVVQRREHF
jgi:hypothetical protein